jgi:hypothetical protein
MFAGRRLGGDGWGGGWQLRGLCGLCGASSAVALRPRSPAPLITPRSHHAHCATPPRPAPPAPCLPSARPPVALGPSSPLLASLWPRPPLCDLRPRCHPLPLIAKAIAQQPENKSPTCDNLDTLRHIGHLMSCPPHLIGIGHSMSLGSGHWMSHAPAPYQYGRQNK